VITDPADKARGEEIDRLRAELELVRGAMRADDERLRAASVRVWGEHRWGCDAPEQMANLIEHLRAELREARPRVGRDAPTVGRASGGVVTGD
jgi:hypothetical protein